MVAQTAAGAKLYIGSAAGSPDDSPEPTWVLVGEVTNFGEFGRVYNLITHNPVAERGTQKFKGSFNDGAMTLEMARVPDDAGQEKLIEALDDDEAWPFKVELGDDPGSPGTPTTFTFEGMVMSYTTNIGTVDQIVAAAVQLEINSGTITETPASP